MRKNICWFYFLLPCDNNNNNIIYCIYKYLLQICSLVSDLLRPCTLFVLYPSFQLLLELCSFLSSLYTFLNFLLPLIFQASHRKFFLINFFHNFFFNIITDHSCYRTKTLIPQLFKRFPLFVFEKLNYLRVFDKILFLIWINFIAFIVKTFCISWKYFNTDFNLNMKWSKY